MSLDRPPKLPNEGGSSEFEPGRELIRLVKLKNPLAAIQIERELEVGGSYAAIAHEYERLWEAIQDYQQRVAAKGNPSLQGDIEAADRKSHEAEGIPERIGDWHEYNEQTISAIQSMFKEWGVDVSNQLGLERFIAQMGDIMEVIRLVDGAEATGLDAERNLPFNPE